MLNNWIVKGSSNDEHLAIDPLGILNPSCSSLKNGKLRSLNLDLRPDLFRRQGLVGPKSAPVIQVVCHFFIQLLTEIIDCKKKIILIYEHFFFYKPQHLIKMVSNVFFKVMQSLLVGTIILSSITWHFKQNFRYRKTYS